jgi:hypothetical protein
MEHIQIFPLSYCRLRIITPWRCPLAWFSCITCFWSCIIVSYFEWYLGSCPSLVIVMKDETCLGSSSRHSFSLFKEANMCRVITILLFSNCWRSSWAFSLFKEANMCWQNANCCMQGLALGRCSSRMQLKPAGSPALQQVLFHSSFKVPKLKTPPAPPPPPPL